MKYVIVGGGLAGLYCAYKLEQKNVQDIELYEKSSRLGGRIKTKVFKDIKYECGPSKILPHHTLVLTLLKELGFHQSDLIEKKMPQQKHHNLIKSLIAAIKKEKRCISLKDLILEKYGNNVLQEVCISTGYHHMVKNNIQSVIPYLKDLLTTKMYVFKPGLSEIVAALVKNLKYTKIHLNSVYTRKESDPNTKVIIAYPPRQGIHKVPLVRIYAITDPVHTMFPYTTTADQIQRYVSISNELHQLVYASGDNARYWKGKKQDEIKKILEDYFKIKIKKVMKYYWPQGVHLDTGCIDEKTDNIGEAYATYKRWMESALITVEKVI